MTPIEVGLAVAAIVVVWRLGTIAEDLADAVRSPKDHRVHLPTLPRVVVEHHQFGDTTLSNIADVTAAIHDARPTTQGEGD